MRRLFFTLACALAAVPSVALAQSVPSWISYGYVPSAGDQRAAFAAKQDVLNFTPLNLAGGTMRGKLSTAPPTVNGAGFAILPGVVPNSPSNGDIWLTAAGLFAQINGVPTQFVGSANLGTMAAQNASNVAITGGTINGTPIGGTTPAPGAFSVLSATTPLPLISGGCGASTAAGCRTNLGLGGAALLNVGTAPGTVADGGDTRITGALPATTAAATYAPLASPALTGTPTAPTPAVGTNTNQIATAAMVTAAAVAGAAYIAPATPSTSTTLATTDFDRDQYASTTLTLTLPNGGAGWRTGLVYNDSTAIGLVTLAVPSGATLDGTTNGTLVLYPYQRARVRQTGASAYRSERGERSPLIGEPQSAASGSPVTAFTWAIPAGYASCRIEMRRIVPATSGTSLYVQMSDDGATTWKAGTDYQQNSLFGQGSAGAGTANFAGVLLGSNVSGAFELDGDVTFTPGGGGAQPWFRSRAIYLDTAISNYTQRLSAGAVSSISANRANGVRVIAASGMISGNASLRCDP